VPVAGAAAPIAEELTEQELTVEAIPAPLEQPILVAVAGVDIIQ
tara:strand:- start:905 stop:1036 length:132 start_codon:yes stop_codon:yes gene_type:complete